MNRRQVIIHLNGHHKYDVKDAFKQVQRAYMPFWYLEPTYVVDNFEPILEPYLLSDVWGVQKGLISEQMTSDYGNAIHLYSIPRIKQSQTNAKGWYDPRSWTIQNYASTKQRWINITTHELSHHFSRVLGVDDKTHEYHPNVDSDFDVMQDGIDGYLFKDKPREVLVIHHSGMKKDSGETIRGIESYHGRKYGRVWYHTIIGEGKVKEYASARHSRQGEFHSTDVMVMGDYRTDKLALSDYWKLKKQIKKHRTVVTHSELADMNYTEPTVCPADLLDQYLKHRDDLVPTFVKLLERKLNLLKQLLERDNKII